MDQSIDNSVHASNSRLDLHGAKNRKPAGPTRADIMRQNKQERQRTILMSHKQQKETVNSNGPVSYEN